MEPIVKGVLSEQLKRIRAIDLGDEKDREEFEAVHMYSKYLVNFGEEHDIEFRGHSWKPGIPMGFLVVRATIKGNPYVSFYNNVSFMGAIRTFIRFLTDDIVQWRPDKYG